MAERSLYDLLEVSPQASPEAIRAAYERLSGKYDPAAPANAGNSAARVQHDAIKEAFFTLGNTEKRKQYDDRLIRARAAMQHVELVRPFWTLPKMIVLGVVLAVVAGFYLSSQKEQARLARIEAEKQIEMARAAEAAEKARAEREQARAELEKTRLERGAEARAAREREAALRRYSIEQRSQYSEAGRAERAAELERRQQEARDQRAQLVRKREEMQAEAAARRQAERERAELCRIERERYGKAISC